MNDPVATNTRQYIYFVTYYILYYLNKNTYINVKQYKRFIYRKYFVSLICAYLYIYEYEYHKEFDSIFLSFQLPELLK